MILWLDFETNGLQTTADILEAAFVLTDDDLNTVWAESLVLRDFMGPVSDVRARSAAVVDAMHAESGLWAEVEESTHSVHEVEGYVIEMLDVLGVTEPVMIGGSGVASFDLQLIRKQMPDLAERLHYQSFDVSPVRRFFRSIGVPDLEEDPDRPAHRAMPDTLSAIAQWRYYRDLATAWKESHEGETS